MTKVSDDLEELVARVEAATGPDRELDLRIEQAVNPEYEGMNENHVRFLVKYGGQRPFTASLDTAMTLVPESCDDHKFSATIWAGITPPNFRSNGARVFRYDRDDEAEGGWAIVASGSIVYAATPALALVAAALRAHREGR